jgi:hypothetical protein
MLTAALAHLLIQYSICNAAWRYEHTTGRQGNRVCCKVLLVAMLPACHLRISLTKVIINPE